MALQMVPVEGNDVYHVDDGVRSKPVVFFVHGGAWHWGSKESNQAICAALAQRGYVAVSTSYCLSSLSNEQVGTALTALTVVLLTLALTCPTVPQMMAMLTLSLLVLAFLTVVWLAWPRETVQHPAHILAVARNFRWVTEHVAEFGGDPQKIAVAGHSAGAHLAALLATNTVYLQQVQVDPALVKACVALSGPYSDRRLAETQTGTHLLHHVFGRRPHYYDAFPVYNVTRDTCPFLLVNTGLDITMKRHAFDFHYVLRQAGVYVKTVYFEDESHWSVVRGWHTHNQAVLEQVLAFLQERWALLDAGQVETP